ncbi:MAG: cadherin-like domain-containing protein, partial [Hymenobacter sp.]|nr:cadherin-like domain-containing protein [Hymenobacter sp.]
MKTPFLSLRRAQAWLKSSGQALLPAVLLLGLAQTTQAQFPRNETFRNASAPNFTLIGARLTGTGSGQPGDDAAGQGYLRLTNSDNDQAGSIIDNLGFDAPDGFTISFEFFAYGGSGADGFSVFLVDQAGQPTTGFRIGASGGSLGYAQKTIAPIAPGVSRGYIGIGIDEFGNFANPTEGRSGGPGFIPDAVSIRGAGDGSGPNDYPYVAGTALNQLGFSLDVPTARAQSGTPDYRRAFIDVVPTGTGVTRTYRITVRIQHGSVVTTTVNNVTVATPPDRLRLGFSGSTGGATNVHEIRNLNIVQAPFANDDLAATRFNQPVTLNAISNDIFPGTGFQANSLDLDFGTPGIQNTFTVPGRGTFTVTSGGQVTFTPLGSFAGTVTIPYTVNDVLGTTTSTSSPANITVIVQGADVATSVSGPTSANPGSTITYAVSTSNLGPVTANNVAVTLQLSPGLPSASVVPSSGTYNAGTGVVTFTPISSLASGATPVVNSVTFLVPGSGTITGTAASTSSSIPDPVDANNTATITTTITGVANVGTTCATPGQDGPLTLTGTNQIVNTYYAGNLNAAVGATTVRVDAAFRGASTPIAAGDVVLIMQMQGANVNITNTNSYGDGVSTGEASGNLSANFTAGRYEYAIVAGTATAGPNTTLTLNKPLALNYQASVFNTRPTGQTGQRRFQVIRVPQYSTLTVAGGSSTTGAAWDGSSGGVLVLDVAGKTIFNGGSLTMTARGFRGGGAKGYDGTTGFANTDVRRPASDTRAGAHGSKGEGTAGTPQFVYAGGTATLPTPASNEEGYENGSTAQGAPGNAGGGSTTNLPGSNGGNSGGGGGGNAGKGGIGGFGADTGGSGLQASGGAPFVGTTSLLVMGGGGGAGSTNATTANEYLSSGGIGGGIIILRTGSVTGTGTITAAGGAAPGAPAFTEGGGGGGAGGTVVVLATPPSGATSSLTGLTVNVNGGRGGDANTTGINSFGPGGGGGGGFIYANSPVAAASTTTAGARGNTTAIGVAFGAAAGNAGASNTSTSADIANTVAGAGGCLPTLTVGLRTSTPTRTRVGAPGSAVNPALYELTVSNTGGEASELQILGNLPANIFSYDNSFTPIVTLTLADNSTSTPSGFTVISGGSTPLFGLATLPAGARLSITFRATIEATANDGLAYQASGQVSYVNPLRDISAASGRVGNAINYYPTDDSYGTPTGSDYSATSSSNEDVTITRPLPVELKRFDVTAVGLNAELGWATATELQNDHFDIERSLDG